jgi:hypothetical protein
MLHAMSCRFLLSSSVLLTALAFLSVAATGCSKDKKDDADAAADAAPEASVVDAAADAADAAVVDAAVVPLTTATATAVRPKVAPPDPPICQKARAARQRNSPSFPALEAQCKAAGGIL